MTALSEQKLKLLSQLGKGPTRFTDVIELLGVSKKRTADHINELEASQLIKKNKETGWYEITEKGIMALAQAEQNAAVASLINVKDVNKVILDEIFTKLFGLILVLWDEGRNLSLFSDANLFTYVPPQMAQKKSPSGFLELYSPFYSASNSEWYQKYGECWEIIVDLASFCERLRGTRAVKFSQDPISKVKGLFERSGLKSELKTENLRKDKHGAGWEWKSTLVKPPSYKEYAQVLEFAIPRLKETIEELKSRTTGLESLVQYFENGIDNLKQAFDKIQGK